MKAVFPLALTLAPTLAVGCLAAEGQSPLYTREQGACGYIAFLRDESHAEGDLLDVRLAVRGEANIAHLHFRRDAGNIAALATLRSAYENATTVYVSWEDEVEQYGAADTHNDVSVLTIRHAKIESCPTLTSTPPAPQGNRAAA